MSCGPLCRAQNKNTVRQHWLWLFPWLSFSHITLWYNRKVDSINVLCFIQSSFNEHVSLYLAHNRITSCFFCKAQTSRSHCFSGGHLIVVCSRMLRWVILSECCVVVVVVGFCAFFFFFFFYQQNTAVSSTQECLQNSKEKHTVRESEMAQQIQATTVTITTVTRT